VADLPFDLNDPPEQPPPNVRHALLWRLALCMLRDHSPGLNAPGTLVRCRACGRVWPCQCRRFAERGLICAYQGNAHASDETEDDGHEARRQPDGPTAIDANSCDEGPASGAIDAGVR
jgi:hypothetical protein